ncbi:hypothetical protein V5799_018009, partial [Amblyomma americanum]
VFRGHSHSIDCQLSPRRCLLQPHGLQCQPCSLVLVATLNGAQTTSGGAVDHFYPPSSSAARPDSMFCLEAKARLHRLPSGTLQRQHACCKLKAVGHIRRTLVARQPQSREQDAPAGTRAPLTSESCPAPIPCPLRWERCPEGPSKGIHMPQAAVGPKKTTAATALSSMPKVFSGPGDHLQGCPVDEWRRVNHSSLTSPSADWLLVGPKKTTAGALSSMRPMLSGPRDHPQGHPVDEWRRC